MKLLRQTLTQLAGSFGVVLSWAFTVHAQAYNQSTYGNSTYGRGLVQIGPVTLPVTGPQLLGIGSVITIAIGVGLLVWLRQRRRHSSATPPTSAV